MCSCHSILECCVTFSGVKLSIRSFVLLLLSEYERSAVLPWEIKVSPLDLKNIWEVLKFAGH